MKDFEKVVEFIKEEEGTDFRRGEVTAYLRGPNRIFMHYNFNMTKNGLMILLHEVGHALQPDENKQMIAGRKYEDGEISKKEFCMAIWETEVDAWERGEQLAKDLNLDIDWDRFYMKMKEGLGSYFESYIEIWE